MARWKQRFVCAVCCHSAWREVVTDVFDPQPPDTRRLEAGGFFCSYCGAREYRVFQAQLPAGRWTDAFKPGGMRVALMSFDLSAGRDAEVHEARRAQGLRDKLHGVTPGR